MRISLIAALDENRGIGVANGLPWHLPADARLFKATTMGHHLISGRRTFESLGKALPGRTHIILSRDPAYAPPEGCLPAPSLKAGLELARNRGEEEVFVIGGADVYAQALAAADRLYLTRVRAVFPVDVYFPPFSLDDWTLVREEEHAADERNLHPFTFQIWERK